MSDDAKTAETYEFIHNDATYEVTTKYVGDTTLIDVIKAALKRDVELMCHSENP